jgi:hypothetical protein
MNTPYVKRFNENGELLNPINGTYMSQHPNRRQRKSMEKGTRMFPNDKGFHMTVTPFGRYIKRYQQEVDMETGRTKIILHYDKPCNYGGY